MNQSFRKLVLTSLAMVAIFVSNHWYYLESGNFSYHSVKYMAYTVHCVAK